MQDSSERNPANFPNEPQPRRNHNMTALGQRVWKEMCRHTSELGVFHPAEYFADVVCLSFKRFPSRFTSDEYWTAAEWRRIYKEIRSEEIKNCFMDWLTGRM